MKRSNVGPNTTVTKSFLLGEDGKAVRIEFWQLSEEFQSLVFDGIKHREYLQKVADGKFQ